MIHQRKLFSAVAQRLKPLGFVVYFEYQIGIYRADIYVHPYWVIEVDGRGHNTTIEKEYDQQRTVFLESLGKKVIRFTNNAVDEDVDSIADSIRTLICPPVEVDPTIFRSKHYRSENGRLIRK